MDTAARNSGDASGGNRRHSAHLRLGVAVAVAGVLFVLSGLSYVTKWDAALVSGLPFDEDIGRFVVAIMVAAVLFEWSLFFVASRQERLRGTLLDLALDSIGISRHTHWWPPVALVFLIVTAAATPAAWRGIVDPWLWTAGAAIAAGMVLAALAPGDRIPLSAQRSVRQAGHRPAMPDASAWWDAVLKSPLYHGQVHQQRVLPERRPAQADENVPFPVEFAELREIYASLVGPSAPIRGYAQKTFELLSRAPLDNTGDGPLCIVDLPHGAGLSTLIAAVATHNRVRQYRRTIVLAPDSARSSALATRLQELIDRDIRWRGTLRIAHVANQRDLGNLAAYAYEDLSDVLVVDPKGLDLVLRLLTKPWDYFFASLGLVAIVGAYGFVGTRGAHVAALIRRLRAVCRRVGSQPAYLVDCIAATEQLRFLNDLLGMDAGIEHVVTDDDTARRCVQVIGWIPNVRIGADLGASRRSFLDEVSWLAAHAAASGLTAPVIIISSAITEDDLTAIREQIGVHAATLGKTIESPKVVASVSDLPWSVAGCDVLIYAGFPTTWVELEHEIALLGIERAEGPKIVLLVAPHEPASIEFTREQLQRTVHTTAEHALTVTNPLIIELHLRALVGTAAFLSDELTILGRMVRPTLQEWEQTGRVATSGTSRVGAIVPNPLHEDLFRPEIDLEATGEAVTKVKDQAAPRAELAHVDRGRAYLIGYPDAHVVFDRNRYVAQRQVDAETIWVVRMGGVDTVTYPVSKIDILPGTGEEDLERSWETSVGTVRLDQRSVTIVEEVIGYRLARVSRPHELGRRTDYPGEHLRRPEFESPAIVLWLVEDSILSSSKVLHTVAHALRVVAPRFVRHRPDDLGMSVVELCEWTNGKPALVVYDNMKLGVGIADRLGVRLESLLSACLDLLMSCPCAEGCAACVGNPSCKRAVAPQDLDKLGAIRLLGHLTRRSDTAEEAIRRRTETITDEHMLAAIADRIVKEVFVPMLGMAIDDMSPILRDDHLPSNVAGRYEGGTNLIRIRPAQERRTFAVLAHELAHAWSLQPGVFSPELTDAVWPGSRDLLIEGFAQWAEAKVLDYFGFEPEINEISGWPPDVYGVGFRFFNRLEEDLELGGVHGVLEFIRAPNKEWLSRYFQTLEYRVDKARIMERVEEGTALPPDWTTTDGAEETEATPGGGSSGEAPGGGEEGAVDTEAEEQGGEPESEEAEAGTSVDAAAGEEISIPDDFRAGADALTNGVGAEGSDAAARSEESEPRMAQGRKRPRRRRGR